MSGRLRVDRLVWGSGPRRACTVVQLLHHVVRRVLHRVHHLLDGVLDDVHHLLHRVLHHVDHFVHGVLHRVHHPVHDLRRDALALLVPTRDRLHLVDAADEEAMVRVEVQVAAEVVAAGVVLEEQAQVVEGGGGAP